MKKIIILYAKYGGGHQSAANALSSYIIEHYSDVQVKVIDCVESVTPFMSKATTNGYKLLAKKAPKIWEKIYTNSPKGILLKTSEISKKYLAKHLISEFNDFAPDLIISVHPFGSQITAYLKETSKLNCKLATVFTDFRTHPQWLIGKEFNDYFFVSNEQMKQELLDLNISENKIFITGVPLSGKFLVDLDIDNVYKELELNKNKKCILFFAGGEFGLGHKNIVEVLRTLVKYIDRYQIIAVSGKNKKMFNQFMNIYDEFKNEDLHIYEYTNHVPELMSISDLVITKPGGLTSSESLASNLPMLLINPIPGQEEENSDYLVGAGAAVRLHDTDNIQEVVSSLLNDSNKLENMKKCANLIAHKTSTKEICEILI